MGNFLTTIPSFQESKFKETGVLTPEEFVAAGDHLVHKCPTWQWAAGDETKAKPYLPKDKQFLITRSVPCYRRCKQMEYVGEETIVEDDSGEGGWVETHHFDDATGQASVEEKLSEMTMDSAKGEAEEEEEGPEEMVSPEHTHNEGDDDDDDDEEACDMEEFAESGMLEKMDPATAVRVPKPEPVAAAKSSKDDNEGGIVKTRTYDLHITYDKYYQTPRLWVVGYDEVGYYDLFFKKSNFNAVESTFRTESH